ncbi:MAG: BlaI/MecI/CopY family transcriptional regulator [Candidatus Eremiobacteraeota bacterium]|nr:BlaI/MecI/CopY family transcriptional regulator [Candidatus Eremiobacteraeota bacterium]
MPRKKSATLTEVEQQLMEILWERRSGTVGEVQSALLPDRKAAFNTVQTTLRILEEKGYVRHRTEGRAFRYYPVVERDAASNSAVRNVLKRFFNGAAGALAINLIAHERLTPEELRRIEQLVQDAKAQS